MRTVLIKSSLRENSNSSKIFTYLRSELIKRGHEVSIVHGESVSPCTGCSSCSLTGRCVHQDDFSSVLSKGADFFIFVGPVYFFGLNSTLHRVLERLYPYNLSGVSLGLALTTGSPFRYGGVDLIIEQFSRIDEYCGSHTVVPFNKVTYDSVTELTEVDKIGLTKLIDDLENDRREYV